MRPLAVLYGAFLLGIVVLADLGALGPLVRGVHAVPLGDKACHLVLATGLGFFAAAFAPAPRVAIRRLRVPLATWAVVVVAIVEEISQRFVPGRTFDLGDLAADAVGLALGTVLALRVTPRSPVLDH